jgi:uncharacterized damage-inducible protein DinB
MDTPIDVGMLLEMARHQTWADAQHWEALRKNDVLLQDEEIRKRLNHMVLALRIQTGRARGETPDPSATPPIESADALEAALIQANTELIEAISVLDLRRTVDLPRGRRGPWQAPAGALLLQVVLHGQHHRGQNAARMRQLGAVPPMTDYLAWRSLGKP